MPIGLTQHPNWLTAARVRAYLWIFALCNFATLLFLVATSKNGVDWTGSLLGTDFLSFWTAGRMLTDGTNVYDTAAHIAAQREYFRRDDGYVAFFYPPPFLLICFPLGLFSYFGALALWLGGTGAAFVFAVRNWLKRAGISTPLWLLVAAFPPVLLTFTHGQTSMLAAALLGGGALLTRERPVAAGLCFGLAVFKPQFGLLVPLMLLLTGEWRVILSAAATALILGIGTTLAFGPAVWTGWIEATAAAQTALDTGVIGFAKMQSPFAAALLLGAPTEIAYIIQGAIAATVVLVICWTSWGQTYSLAHGSLMLAGTPLITPFVLDYDLVILAFPLLWLAGRGVTGGQALLAGLTFVAAFFARPLAVTVGMPIMPFVLVSFFLLLAFRVRREPARSCEWPLEAC